MGRGKMVSEIAVGDKKMETFRVTSALKSLRPGNRVIRSRKSGEPENP